MINNLYPPIVDSYMPAFIYNKSCNIYFSLFNKSDIKNIQIVINYQNTNLSAFNQDIHPTGIKIVPWEEVKSEGDLYYITIDSENENSDIHFEINQFYKVQLRLTGATAEDLPKPSEGGVNKIATWLSNNQSHFSEWSTVCLIRGIERPQIDLKGFDSGESVILTSQTIDFIGRMHFNDLDETEKLNNYRIRIYHTDNLKDSLVDSGIIYTNDFASNEINYSLAYPFEDMSLYIVKFEYSTDNLYSETIDYYFRIIQYGLDKLDVEIAAIPDNDEGRIKINLIPTTERPFYGNITIRRTSSESNFIFWEDVHTATLTDGKPLEYSWYDMTAQSGVQYKYCVQKRNSHGDRGVIVKIENPVRIILDDMFLTTENKQLKIQFDSNINSFKHIVSESKVDTIGGKFPFIKRNGNTFYKHFSISGLITYKEDINHMFINEELLYKNVNQKNPKYCYETNNSLFNDYNYFENENQEYIIEQNFREEVMKFLYDDSVKLFRTATEGNILIKLMDISFTPNQTLGRLIYSFSATAYEVDEANIENYDKYSIQKRGNFNEIISYTRDVLGQLQGVFSGKEQDFSTIVRKKYDLIEKAGFKNEINYFSWLRFEFESAPYLIREGENEPHSVSKDELRQMTEEEKQNEILSGYIIYIDDKAIIVPGYSKYFELKGNEIQIKSIYFPEKTQGTFDYVCSLSRTEDTSKYTNKISYHQKIGQYWGVFNANDSISKRLYLKYLENKKKYYQRLICINGISVEAEPGTVIYAKDSLDSDFNRHIIGESGNLQLYNENNTLDGIYFYGKHMVSWEEAEEDESPDNIFFETSNTGEKIYVDSFEDILEPQENFVYWVASFVTEAKKYNDSLDLLTVERVREIDENTIINDTDKAYSLFVKRMFEQNRNRYIYHNKQWHLFSETNDILCPVEAIVDYYCEIVKGEY